MFVVRLFGLYADYGFDCRSFCESTESELDCPVSVVGDGDHSLVFVLVVYACMLSGCKYVVW